MFLGAILIVLGLIAMVMPLVPGAWLVFIGLELLGIRYVVWDSNDRFGKFLLKIGVPKKYLK